MRSAREEAPAPEMSVTSGRWPSFPVGGRRGAAGEEKANLGHGGLQQLPQWWQRLGMDARDCEAASEPGPPACACVASWWDVVLRNLR